MIKNLREKENLQARSEEVNTAKSGENGMILFTTPGQVFCK